MLRCQRACYKIKMPQRNYHENVAARKQAGPFASPGLCLWFRTKKVQQVYLQELRVQFAW